MNVIVDGLMVNYQKTGKGPTILILHGWGDSSSSFLSLSAKLAQKNQVISLDLPGFGGSQNPGGVWGVEDYVAFVASFIKKTSLGELEALVGHSFGGAVAIWGVGEGKLKPKRLVLLAAAGIRNKKSLKRRIIWLVAKLMKLPMMILPKSLATKLRRSLYEKIGSDVMVVPAMRETFVQTVRQDVRHKARDIKIPTLLIYGSQDDQTPPSDGRIFNKLIENSQLEIINGAGHFIHQEEPDAVAAKILEFLK